MRHVMAAAVITGLTAAAGAQPWVFETYSRNTGLSGDGGGVFFDLESIAAGSLVVNAIGFETWTPGTNVEVRVYTRAGSWFGFDEDPSAWTLHDTVIAPSTSGSSTGPFTVVDIAPLNIPSGSLTGMYLYLGTNGIRYASDAGVTAAGNPLNDGRMQIHAGMARGSLFGPGAFGNGSTSFRGFAGEIHYVPTPGALALLGLGGLVAARRRR